MNIFPKIFIEFTCVLFIIFSCGNSSLAQDPGLLVKVEIEKPLPDFVFDDISNYYVSKPSKKDFSGKWLVLDFWSTHCVTCIQSFPKVNNFQKKFNENLTWVMVGVNDEKHKDSKSFYNKFKTKRGLDLIVAYDSVLVNKWEVNSMPHIIIVNPEGIVKYITDGRDMTEEKIQRLIAGNPVNFFSKESVSNKQFEVEPFSSTDRINDNQYVLFRSVLSKWHGEQQNGGYEINRFVQFAPEYLQNGWTVSMIPLYALYNYAYVGEWRWDFKDSIYGKIYPMPILEIKDSSMFHYNYGSNGIAGMYNYNLTIPPKEVTKQRLMSLMQDDLKRYFNYVVSVEDRPISVWKLIEIKKGAASKLKTKGGKKYSSPGTAAAGYQLINHPPEYLIASISFYISEKFQEPFVDETGIRDFIDFKIDADMTNLEDIRKALQLQGLDLIKGTRIMKAIVIKDRS